MNRWLATIFGAITSGVIIASFYIESALKPFSVTGGSSILQIAVPVLCGIGLGILSKGALRSIFAAILTTAITSTIVYVVIALPAYLGVVDSISAGLLSMSMSRITIINSAIVLILTMIPGIILGSMYEYH